MVKWPETTPISTFRVEIIMCVMKITVELLIIFEVDTPKSLLLPPPSTHRLESKHLSPNRTVFNEMDICQYLGQNTVEMDDV